MDWRDELFRRIGQIEARIDELLYRRWPDISLRPENEARLREELEKLRKSLDTVVEKVSSDGKAQGKNDGGRGRFWENYLVRYIGGTFVGTVSIAVLMSLNVEGASQLKNLFAKALGESPSEGIEFVMLVLVIGIGFTFSYIASAPIYVLHLLRTFLLANKWFHADEDAQDASEKKVSLNLAVPISITAALGIAITTFICFSFVPSQGVHLDRVMAWLLLLVVIAMQVAGLLRLFWSSQSMATWQKFYTFLSQRRANNNSSIEVSDFVESYRHLREHGNASLIVIFNILLAVFVSLAPDVQSIGALIVLWTLPAGVGWFAASALENHMLQRNWPKVQLDKKI
ncbi:MAG TPA: hypothetical protein VF275_10105 [Gammaproteobacteria bacterium]